MLPNPTIRLGVSGCRQITDVQSATVLAPFYTFSSAAGAVVTRYHGPAG